MNAEPGTTHDSQSGTTITLTYDDQWWVASDENTGVTSQGKTRQEALENLDEALEGFHGKGEPPTDTELRELGISPEQNVPGSIENSEIFE